MFQKIFTLMIFPNICEWARALCSTAGCSVWFQSGTAHGHSDKPTHFVMILKSILWFFGGVACFLPVGSRFIII